jgi:hypothetical protein
LGFGFVALSDLRGLSILYTENAKQYKWSKKKLDSKFRLTNLKQLVMGVVSLETIIQQQIRNLACIHCLNNYLTSKRRDIYTYRDFVTKNKKFQRVKVPSPNDFPNLMPHLIHWLIII